MQIKASFKYICFAILFAISINTFAQNNSIILPIGKSEKWVKKATHTQPGAYQLKKYLPLLKGKRVGVFANPTSVIGHTHLVDSLQHLGIQITKIFGPEHGFRGTADAGAHVESFVDQATGIKVISLYGKKSHPSKEDLADVDILLFDLQDVGLRFYTYILSLQNFMESAIDNRKPLIILDRPNPNGFYVDGPVLDTAYKSGVGPQPIPVVYGMTIGEYAKMVLGEKWLHTKYAYMRQDDPLITIIPCKHYNHKYLYQLPVAPSPNLKSMNAIYWYASTCFFEGTNLSEGRGTSNPFLYVGGPDLPKNLFQFEPKSQNGALDPKCKDQICYGWDLTRQPSPSKIDLSYIKNAYDLTKDKSTFFLQPKDSTKPENYFFNKLAGNQELRMQIIQQRPLDEIYASWESSIQNFKTIRKKYLLYKDF
ncbi:exo-beta-N-acetylmuramidase NamZ family protein [Rhizosphaericola mali]|uniref:DUF1343 domain-containing protein n=1 Tax=Rhizosphaericola mali TaxID=2545455 RepID=A0A5P2G2W4_9BACT|nr:DUF1343 domain-containing protein [Rhizosphaericola mali]QES90136.1 DUF1343 domain-containing protein [Rhizosphaericola mali]